MVKLTWALTRSTNCVIDEDGTNWLLRETWHAITSTNTFDLVRYWYANGRPSRVEVASTSSDLQYVYGYNTYYIQYNWHGDAVTYIALDGSGGGSWGAYDPWGNPTSWPPPALAAWNYYRWNGAWGYLRLDALNLYYVHGRWYNPDTGLFLSPDANGSYIYYDNDPINKHANAAPPRAHWPSECLGGLTNGDPRDLTCWLFREMKHNLDDPRLQAVRLANWASRVNPIFFPNANYAGAFQFYLLVADRKPWDFKHKIQDRLGRGITMCSSAGCQNTVEYSVPGNIHYGFVAREAGYDSQIVHLGAGIAEIFDPSHRLDPKDSGYTPYEGQIGCTSGAWCLGPFGWSLNLGDEPKDHQAVQFGIMLYDKYAGGRGLTFPTFQLELSKGLPLFATEYPDLRPVRDDVAKNWPYPVGYFDPTRP
jgi:RHS repeat-associated protein